MKSVKEYGGKIRPLVEYITSCRECNLGKGSTSVLVRPGGAVCSESEKTNEIQKPKEIRQFKSIGGCQNRVLKTALNIIARNGDGPISHRVLLQNSNLTADQFAACVKSLTDEGVFSVARTSSGRGKVYILKEENNVQQTG